MTDTAKQRLERITIVLARIQDDVANGFGSTADLHRAEEDHAAALRAFEREQTS